MARTILVVSLLVAAVTAQCPAPSKDSFVDSIPFNVPRNAHALFLTLDTNKDKVITADDLHNVYYLSEIQAEASNKFVKLITGKDNGATVSPDELAAFLNRPQVKLQLYECDDIKSTSIRNICLRDHITNYAYLVLDDIKDGTTTEFFNYLEDPKDKDKVITEDDLAKFKWDSKSVTNFMRELGGDCGNPIDQIAFDNYVTHEDLGANLRSCKIKGKVNAKTGLPEYDLKCLTDKLIFFINNRDTELDQYALFTFYDQNKGKFVDAQTLQEFTKLPLVECTWFVELIKALPGQTVTYGEFRSIWRRTRSLRGNLVKSCQTVGDQDKQLKCFTNNIAVFIKSHPVLRMLDLPDDINIALDVTSLFENLDKNGDGKIQEKELTWTKQNAVKNFISELNGPATSPFHLGNETELDEFQHYTSLEHMVLGISDCLDIDDGNARLTCYEQEYEDMLSIMLLTGDVEGVYKYFNTEKNDDDIITLNDLKDPKFGLTADQAQYLLTDMSMGDGFVAYGEFEWFIRQKPLLKKYAGKTSSADYANMAKIIWDYVNNQMTEDDIEDLFKSLDTDNNGEITSEDFKGTGSPSNSQVSAFIAAVARKTLLGLHISTKGINFYDWWLFLNTPLGKPRKDVNFQDCASKHTTEKDEFTCYKQKLFDSSIYKKKAH